MKVLIVGANGKVGTILSGKLWAAHDFSPVALIRNPMQQTKFTAMGVPSVVGDLEHGIEQFLPGLDAVVFTAGSGARTGPDKTIDVDQNAAIRLIDDCSSCSVSRFIMVSAIGADPKSESDRIRHYLRAKGVADEHLTHSGLDFSILAPGSLLDEPGRDRVQAAENLGVHGSIPREDVANCIVECLRNRLTIGRKIEVIAGDLAVSEAISTLVGGAPHPPIP